PGSPGSSPLSAPPAVSTTATSRPSPSGSLKTRLPGARVTSTSAARSRSSQKSSASCEPTRKTTACNTTTPGPPSASTRGLEEGDVGAGRALFVRVEEVVDRRIVLVDGLLDQPQPEHSG